MFYLAAAVSDFYVPWASLPEHKLQSQNGALNLDLAPVPKCVDLIRAEWAPGAFVISFKLETNKDLLEPKAESALVKHNAHCVVANLLETRKDECALLLLLCFCTVTSKDWLVHRTLMIQSAPSWSQEVAPTACRRLHHQLLLFPLHLHLCLAHTNHQKHPCWIIGLCCKASSENGREDVCTHSQMYIRDLFTVAVPISHQHLVG
jgi:hypothetical protein